MESSSLIKNTNYEQGKFTYQNFFTGVPMQTKVYDCSTEIPANGTIDNFTGLTPAKCTFCKESCDPPIVDSFIGFFDGVRLGPMAIAMIILPMISITYEVIRMFKMNPEAEKELEKLKAEVEEEDGE